MKTFAQFCETSYDPEDIVYKGIRNPNTYANFKTATPINDQKWSTMFRKQFDVAQRKFKANFKGYYIKRYEKDYNINRLHGRYAIWGGRVYHEENENPIGSFYFSVQKYAEYKKPVLYIDTLVLFAPDLDANGKQYPDYAGKQTEHRGVMTGVATSFMDMVKDDIEFVVMEDASRGYWEAFFRKRYPKLTVFNV